jgi:hypothetical protein
MLGAALVLHTLGAAVTEAEWDTCTDPQPMLEFLHGRASERKLRLFGVACFLRVWHLLSTRLANHVGY